MTDIASRGLPLHGIARPSSISDPAALRLRSDNLLVLLDIHTEQRSECGLHIIAPTYVDVKTPVWGTVVAAGPGRSFDNGKQHDAECKPGDRVLVEHALCGDAVVIDGREHRIIRETSVILVDG